MPIFNAGQSYSREAIFAILGIEDPGGGSWYTGLHRYGDDHYIFCGVGVGGRTGHNYNNYFDGPELIWHGRNGSKLAQPSIQVLLNGVGSIHVFFRDSDRSPFTYAGIGQIVSVQEVVPVEIRFSFANDPGPHPEYLPDEAGTRDTLIEGAKRSITVNVYERDPAARARCIRKWGTACVACGFSFATKYGVLGQGYIHVHHVRPLGEIRGEYFLNPEDDLRPVCPNCHAMLHRTKPAMSIDALKAVLGAM